MPRYRNTSGQVLISQEFGSFGPNELAPEYYDPDLHGALPGFDPVGDEPPDDGEASAAGDGKSTRKRGGAAGDQQKETGE